MMVRLPRPLDRVPIFFVGEKAFHSKLLLLKFVAQDEATEGIIDIIVLSSHHKERVPPKYKRLP